MMELQTKCKKEVKVARTFLGTTYYVTEHHDQATLTAMRDDAMRDHTYSDMLNDEGKVANLRYGTIPTSMTLTVSTRNRQDSVSTENHSIPAVICTGNINDGPLTSVAPSIKKSLLTGTGNRNRPEAGPERPGDSKTGTLNRLGEHEKRLHPTSEQNLNEIMWDPIKKHEIKTTSHFIINSSNTKRDFGAFAIAKIRRHALRWENGIPYYIMGKIHMECHQGPGCKKWKKKNKINEEKSDNIHCSSETRKYRKFHISKKRNCPAFCTIQHRVYFHDYFEINHHNRGMRRESKTRLLEAMMDGHSLKMEHTLLYALAAPEDHKYHITKEEYVRPSRKGKRKKGLVFDDKVTSVSELSNKVKIFVDENVGLELSPKHRKLGVNAKHSTLSTEEMNDDQEKFQEAINDYSSKNLSDNIFYRPRSSDTDILVCHQTKFQKHLLKQYGNEIIALNATYQTTRYFLPLYFLCVETNSSYQVVGWFITQTETKTAISEGLSVFKLWNPLWNPRFCMTDFCMQEISAFEGLFPETRVLICDFDRIKAWGKWCKTIKNGVAGFHDEPMKLMTAVADATNEVDFHCALLKLTEHKIWKNEKFRIFFEETWLTVQKGWVKCYRQDCLLVLLNTNDDVESQNGLLEDQDIRNEKKHALNNLVSILLYNCLPDIKSRSKILHKSHKRKHDGEVVTADTAPLSKADTEKHGEVSPEESKEGGRPECMLTAERR